MYKKTLLTVIVSAALFSALSVFPVTSVMTTTAQAASTKCLPGVVKKRLAQIRSKFGKVRVISTHRPGARIAGSGKRSYHASCRAVDFHPPKGKYRAVLAWLKSNHKGGVGSYSCGMHHLHVDNGPRVRFHHCVNKVGTPLRKGRKKKYYAKRKSKKSYKNYAYKKPRKAHKPTYSLGHKQYRPRGNYGAVPRTTYKKTFSFYNSSN